MIDTPNSPLNREKIIPYLTEKFPDVNFISKPKDDAQIEKNVKTAFVAGESIDIVGFWTNQMRTFTESNMALDLTPYLNADPEWKSVWIPSALESGNYDGKYVAVCYRSNYPLMQANNKLLAEAGITIKDNWNWDEFLDICKKIKAKYPDVYPIAINSQWGCWFIRNGLLQIWNDDAEMEQFNSGKISFTDPRVKQVFDRIKFLYDNNYLYPGEGALTLSGDQALSAFARGKAAILGNVNGNAIKVLNSTVAGAFEVATVSWPKMGNRPLMKLLGSNDGYFCMANTKNPDKVVDVLKAITSPAVLQMWVDDGKIVPSQKVTSNFADYKLYGKDASSVAATEIIQISNEINDYLVNNMPANYLLYGDKAIAELEELRKQLK